MKIIIPLLALVAWSIVAFADDTNFSDHLHAKFQVKACTTCHDFFDKDRGGLSFKSHEGRTPDMCVYCHTKEVTGFKHPEDWFAQPDLYTSGMDPRQTCEAIKKALHAKFKSNTLITRQLELHLFEDPRVLWGIEDATPQSGMLPTGKKEKDLVKEGMAKWKEQVGSWIQGGMKCQ
jgi:hypothetical protein